MKILMIAPSAPPKNDPEAIQVGRYIQEFDKNHKITIVTTPTLKKGWVNKDNSLDIQLKNTSYHLIKLPFHSFTIRLLSSKYCRFIVKKQPDRDFWMIYKVSNIIRHLKYKPDIIYSRSMPFSSALLAMKLKTKLGIPWIMHLSDPWIDSPYRNKTNYDARLKSMEEECFKNADIITLTTESMAAFYKSKYSEHEHKIKVSHNVMPNQLNETHRIQSSNKNLKLMYAGALYGKRRATTLLEGLLWIKNHSPDLLEKLEITIIGNMTQDISEEISKYNFPQVNCIGSIQYSRVIEIQNKSDILISIEPEGKNPLYSTFMPSKVLDYMASGKSILAITPKNSPSWNLCKKGFGWAIMPDDGESLGQLINQLIKRRLNSPEELIKPSINPLIEYTPEHCLDKLMTYMSNLINNRESKK